MRMKGETCWACPDFDSSTSTGFPSLIYVKFLLISIKTENSGVYCIFKWFLKQIKPHELILLLLTLYLRIIIDSVAFLCNAVKRQIPIIGSCE